VPAASVAEVVQVTVEDVDDVGVQATPPTKILDGVCDAMLLTLMVMLVAVFARATVGDAREVMTRAPDKMVNTGLVVVDETELTVTMTGPEVVVGTAHDNCVLDTIVRDVHATLLILAEATEA
jgi:hypothetical protein